MQQKKKPAFTARGDGGNAREEQQRSSEEAFAALVEENFKEGEGITADGAVSGAGEQAAAAQQGQIERFLDRVRQRRERLERRAGKQESV